MIFLDANFLISLFIQTEEEHNQATNIYEKIKDQPLIISNSIILEVMTVSNIKIKISPEKLRKLYNTLNSGKFGIIEDIHLYDDAIERMLNYHPERLPLFDCLYIEIMKQLGIKKMVTFDKHFNNKEIEVIGNPL